MTTIALLPENDNISAESEDKPVSEDGTDKIELSLPNTSGGVSFPSSQSVKSSTNQHDKEIPGPDNKTTPTEEEEKIIDNSEVQEPKITNSTDECADSVNNQISSSQEQSQEKLDDDDANGPNINNGLDRILDSDEDDVYASFKLKKSSKPSTKKMFTIVDSDSEDENIFAPKQQNNEEVESISGMSENTDLTTKSKNRSRLTNVVDSDSDDNSTNNPEEEKSGDQIQKPNNLKKLAIVDSDSESDNAAEESSGDENDGSHEAKKKKIYKTKKMSKVIRDLVDSDDSESGSKHTNDRALSDASDENRNEGKPQGKSVKKRKGSARASKDAAMHQIHSETQRLLRESDVTLPYHRPKQRTLQEFLNRKKISSSLPKGPTTAAKVKMFDDLIIKAVEEKEKEAEMFFKSSDSEEEMELPNKTSESVKESQDSADQNLDNREVEKTQMDVDDLSNENDRQLFAASPCVLDILPSNNLNSIEQNDEVAQSQDTTDKTEEAHMEAVDKNISHVSRKLFVTEIENEENSETALQELQKNCETSIQNLENSKDAGNSKDNTVMETDTNDFELRFSTADFDTDLNLIDLESNCRETEASTKTADNEKSEIKNTEVNETSGIEEKEKQMDDEGLTSVISKGHVLGLPPPDFDDDIIKKKTLKKKIPSYFLNVKPTLHGLPGTTITLSEKVKVNHEGVKKLVDRFVRHSNVHKSEEHPDVTVIHTEVTSDGLKIMEQVLPYKVPTNSEESELNKPGAKLQKLREELQQKISSKRNEEWRQKEEASKALDEYLGDEIDNEDKDDLLPDEEEELDDESAESEPEEDDVLIKENKKTNCAFADDEAEVSDDNGDNQVEDDEEEEEEEEEEEVVEEEEEEEEQEESKLEEDEQVNADDHPKKLRRITTAFEDDSNLSEPEISENEVKEDRKKHFQRTKTDVDMFDDGSDGWTSQIEDENRPKMLESANPVCPTPLFTSNILGLMSPLTPLTALNKSLSPEKKNSTSKESDSTDLLSQESALGETRPQCDFQNKLFSDSPAPVNDEELMEICSGKFDETQHISKALKPLMNPPQMNVTDSQLLELCSGKFSSQPIDETSQDIKLTFDEKSKSPMKYSPRKTVEVKSLGSRLKVVSSDEEDEITKEEGEKKRKRKITKLVLSDDEDNGDKEEESDFSEEEVENEEEEDEEKFVDYDSEENEVVVIPKKDIKKVAAKFVDAEAELSESDWDSVDEDERDLDKLEKEDGDDDVIDEDQMRNQLGKIHARQVLDDDQREVRLLQDMLFEDGDLHSDGAGRERKFKWKNMDKLVNEWNDSKASEDSDMIVDALEDASELELRKHRYEQQKFLEKQKKDSTVDIEEDLNDSQIFKFGLRIVKTVKTSFSRTEESLPNTSKKPLAPSIIPNLLEVPGKLQSSTIQYAKRGSFLARGEQALARIASMIDEKDKMIRAPLNGRRFVFEHISPSVKDAEETNTDEEASTSNKKSRKRTSTSDSTPKSVKKKKVNEERFGGKKLFN